MFFRKFPKAEKQFEEDTNTFCRVNPESQDNATPSEPKNRNPLKDFRKSIGFSAFFSKHKKEGSLSLEAAVAVPVFLMAVLAFYSFFPALMSCLKLKAGMEEAGRTIAGCYYIKEKLTESDDAGKSAELAALAGEDLRWLPAYGPHTHPENWFEDRTGRDIILHELRKTVRLSGRDPLALDTIE